MLSREVAHRQNEDGTHDSICMDCFATIATVGSETDLYRYESIHVCDPVNLYRTNQARMRPPYARGPGQNHHITSNVVR